MRTEIFSCLRRVLLGEEAKGGREKYQQIKPTRVSFFRRVISLQRVSCDVRKKSPGEKLRLMRETGQEGNFLVTRQKTARNRSHDGREARRRKRLPCDRERSVRD